MTGPQGTTRLGRRDTLPFCELCEGLAVEHVCGHVSLGLQTCDLAGMKRKSRISLEERKQKPGRGCGSCAVGGRITDGFPRLQRLSPLPATMANASAKKTAASNERAISNLRQGLLIATSLSMLIRIIFRTKSISPTQLSFWVHIISHIPSTLIARYLARIGEPKRTGTGELISPGEDLKQPGVIEWGFDIIYVTCKRVTNSPTATFWTVFYRGVSSWECDIW